MEWGSRYFAVVGLRELLVCPETFAVHFKTRLLSVGFSH